MLHAQAAQSGGVGRHCCTSQPGKWRERVRLQLDVLPWLLLRWIERSEAVPAPLRSPEVTDSPGCQLFDLILSAWPMVEKSCSNPLTRIFLPELHRRAVTPTVTLTEGERSGRNAYLHPRDTQPGKQVWPQHKWLPIFSHQVPTAEHSNPHTLPLLSGRQALVQ